MKIQELVLIIKILDLRLYLHILKYIQILKFGTELGISLKKYFYIFFQKSIDFLCLVLYNRYRNKGKPFVENLGGFTYDQQVYRFFGTQ